VIARDELQVPGTSTSDTTEVEAVETGNSSVVDATPIVYNSVTKMSTIVYVIWYESEWNEVKYEVVTWDEL
jgi:hypothetical protein